MEKTEDDDRPAMALDRFFSSFEEVRAYAEEGACRAQALVEEYGGRTATLSAAQLRVFWKKADAIDVHMARIGAHFKLVETLAPDSMAEWKRQQQEIAPKAALASALIGNEARAWTVERINQWLVDQASGGLGEYALLLDRTKQMKSKATTAPLPETVEEIEARINHGAAIQKVRHNRETRRAEALVAFRAETAALGQNPDPEALIEAHERCAGICVAVLQEMYQGLAAASPGVADLPSALARQGAGLTEGEWVAMRTALEEGERQQPFAGASAQLAFDVQPRSRGFGKIFDLTCETFERVQPLFRSPLDRLRKKKLIHARPREGQAPGAFVHASLDPDSAFVVAPFGGNFMSVLRLGHELMHCVHCDVLQETSLGLREFRASAQGEALALLGEALVVNAMLDSESESPMERLALRSSFLQEKMRSGVELWAAFHYRRAFFEAAVNGRLNGQTAGTIFAATMKGFWGPSWGQGNPSASWGWMFNDFTAGRYGLGPFGDVAYIYATLVADALMGKRREMDASRKFAPGTFGRRLRELMRGNSFEPFPRLLNRLFGLDTESVDFWRRGIERLRTEITRFANDKAAHAIAFPAGPGRPLPEAGGSGEGRFRAPEV